MEQAVDLLCGEWFESIVVDLDADGDGIDIRYIPPSADTGLPGAQVIIQHMMDGAVAADDIVCADLGTSSCKCL